MGSVKPCGEKRNKMENLVLEVPNVSRVEGMIFHAKASVKHGSKMGKDVVKLMTASPWCAKSAEYLVYPKGFVYHGWKMENFVLEVPNASRADAILGSLQVPNVSRVELHALASVKHGSKLGKDVVKSMTASPWCANPKL